MQVDELADQEARPPRTLRQALVSRSSREEPIFLMTRYVIGPDVAIHLARGEAVIPGEHRVLAPALLRSQILSLLYQAVQTVSWRTSHGRSLTSSAGPMRSTPSTSP